MPPLRFRIQPHDGPAYERVLTGDEAVVGRAPTADLLLGDALVSRQHARFSRRPDGWWVEDLGARNRTFLNGRELGVPSPVRPGDVLRIGQTLFHVIDEAAASDAAVEVLGSGTWKAHGGRARPTMTVDAFAPEDVGLLTAEEVARRIQTHEMAQARTIQAALVPARLPAVAGVDLAVALVSSPSVAGDVYDVHLASGVVWLFIADVAGRGIPAVVSAAAASALFRALVNEAPSPAALMSRLNRALCADDRPAALVTALIARFEPDGGRLTVCEAGHTSPVLRRREGVAYPTSPRKSMALGVLAEATFSETTLTLQSGDMLVLVSDGAVQARSRAGETFDLARIDRSLEHDAEGARDGGLQPVVDGLVRDILRFTGDAPLDDDVVVLALRYRDAAR